MTAGVLLLLGCVAGDLAAGRPVTTSTAGDVSAITAAARLPDGSVWDAPGTVKLRRGTQLTIDLGEERTIRAVEIQADNDDDYLIEGSVDGGVWRTLWQARGVSGAGLRTRHRALDEPAPARSLRISARGGDGFYSVAHLGAFCEVPADWPAEPSPYSPVAWWESIDNDSMLKSRARSPPPARSSCSPARSSGGAAARRSSAARATASSPRSASPRSAPGSTSSTSTSTSCTHVWDIYHYYVGAKYFPELGYTRLYECTVVAESELFGPAAVDGRRITDLVTNELVPVAPVLADPARCKSHFSDERWRDFTADIRFFRRQFAPSRWSNEVLHDHGYNATPVWGALGRALASLGPATTEQIQRLALLDPILLAVMWGFVVWAFGWRVACVGLLWWGTNYPARFWWNGGAFLRMDWLALAIIGICLVKRGRPGAGGFALAWSALLRIFPGFIFIALFLQVVVGWVRARRVSLTPEIRRFAVGAALAGVVLLPVSLALAPGRGGVGALADFVDNSRKHLETPLTNNMGWKTIVAYQTETRVRVEVSAGTTDPFGPWKDARRKVFVQRLPNLRRRRARVPRAPRLGGAGPAGVGRARARRRRHSLRRRADLLLLLVPPRLRVPLAAAAARRHRPPRRRRGELLSALPRLLGRRPLLRHQRAGPRPRHRGDNPQRYQRHSPLMQPQLAPRGWSSRAMQELMTRVSAEQTSCEQPPMWQSASVAQPFLKLVPSKMS